MNSKIAILARSENASPKVLAQSLHHMLLNLDVRSDIFWDAPSTIRRLRSFEMLFRDHKLNWKGKLGFLINKLRYYFIDASVIKTLNNYSALVLCECIPNAFWRNHLAIEQFRKLLPSLPIILYEVYYLGNAPTQINRLVEMNDPGIERYNWHLAISEVTEIRSSSMPPWSCIGLDIAHTGLKPVKKEELIAVVDFPQKGYETYRKEQIKVLNELDIETIVLEKHYTLEEIREVYKKACMFFIQSPEAFGLPIAECLSTGAYIFTPNSGWPMSWRLDKNPKIHKSGILPEIFQVYDNINDLRYKLSKIQKTYDLKKEPFKVFNIFQEKYPYFYQGNLEELRKVADRIRQKNLK